MRLVDIVRSAQGMRTEDQDGWVETLEFSPGLCAEEIEELERSLPCALPQEVRELLAFSRGFENGPIDICFSGLVDSFGMEEVFPSPLVIAHDGFGSYWVIDLLPGSATWGPIFYVCHDPAVVVSRPQRSSTSSRRSYVSLSRRTRARSMKFTRRQPCVFGGPIQQRSRRASFASRPTRP